jgi:hypothetical protein
MFKSISRTLFSAASLIALSMGAAACDPAVPTGAAAQTKANNMVNETLHVESRAGKVMVHFTVDNRTPQMIYVPKAIATEDQLFGRLFEVRHLASGDMLDYTGPMVKRGPITADDYLAIKSRSKHTNTLNITHSFAFRPGTHTYELKYAGIYLNDVRSLDKVSTLELPPVQFSHTAK